MRYLDPGGITYVPNQDLYHKQLAPLKLNVVNMELLAHDISRDKLGEIATRLQKLTYGQMIALADELWRIACGMNGPTGEAVNGLSLPVIFHKWSTSGTP